MNRGFQQINIFFSATVVHKTDWKSPYLLSQKKIRNRFVRITSMARNLVKRNCCIIYAKFILQQRNRGFCVPRQLPKCDNWKIAFMNAKAIKNKNKSLYGPYLTIMYVNVIILAEKWTKIKWIVNNIISCLPLEMCHCTSGWNE